MASGDNLPMLLGRAKSFGLRMAEEIKNVTVKRKLLDLPMLYTGVTGETLAGFLSVEELVTLSMASRDSSNFKGAYKQRHFTTKLTELMGKRTLVLRTIESRSDERKRRALTFMLFWIALALVAVPAVLAASQSADVDGVSVPPQAAVWLAAACALITVLTPRRLCSPFFHGNDEARPHQILSRMGQNVVSRIVGGDEQDSVADKKSCFARLRQLRNPVFCFRATWTMASISFLVLPSTVPISSQAVRIFVGVAAPLVHIFAIVCAMKSGCSWRKENSEEELANLPRPKRWLVKAAMLLFEVLAEGAALIFFLFIFSGYITLTVMGEACPQLAFQLLSMNAGCLLVIALSFTRCEIMFFLTVMFQVYTWTETILARVHKGKSEDTVYNNATCPGQVWPWANVAVGSLILIWACYEQLSSRSSSSRSSRADHEKLQTKEIV